MLGAPSTLPSLKEIAANNDKDFSLARTLINVVFYLGYAACAVIVIAAICGVYGDGLTIPIMIGWSVGLALGLFVTQQVVNAIFEVVKNTRQIRDELQMARRQRSVASPAPSRSPAPASDKQPTGAMVYNQLTHEYEKR